MKIEIARMPDGNFICFTRSSPYFLLRHKDGEILEKKLRNLIDFYEKVKIAPET